MRIRRFHHWMSRLALAATLLLLLVPTTGRVLGASQPAVAGGGLRLCTDDGGTARLPVADSPRDHDAPASPASPHPGSHEDCEYCPLLGTLDLPGDWAPSAPPLLAAAVVDGRHATPTSTRRHPTGLGSRGPPLPLQAKTSI